jgi:hypothetical protein
VSLRLAAFHELVSFPANSTRSASQDRPKPTPSLFFHDRDQNAHPAADLLEPDWLNSIPVHRGEKMSPTEYNALDEVKIRHLAVTARRAPLTLPQRLYFLR